MPEDTGRLIDPYGGIDDLKKKRLRVLHDKSFLDDPTRIFRAARFEQRLSFKMSHDTEKLLAEAARSGCLDTVSGSRIRKEVFAVMEEDEAAAAAARLASFGVWEALAPGLRVSTATVKGMRDIKKAEGALLHKLKAPYDRRYAMLNVIAAGAPSESVKALCVRLGLNRKRAAEAASLAQKSGDVLRFLRRHPRTGVLWERLRSRSNETLLALYALGGDSVRSAIVRFTLISGIRPLITGRDLTKMNYPPGAGYSEVLDSVYKRQLDGELKVKEQALTAAMKLFREKGYGR
jgi:tRNA nucleotidyltransferase (CCA-adding enzyme)